MGINRSDSLNHPEASASQGNGASSPWAWFWRHPLLLVIIANCIFSLGIWNAQDGYGEDTGPVLTAIRCLRTQTASDNLYVNGFAFLLSGATPDPVNAAVLMRFISSLLGSVSLYLVLSCFSKYLSRGAILFASFVWTASCLNAPAIQSTSLSSFSFGIMMMGVYCLLYSWSAGGVIGFYLLGLTAASLRPEYMAPILLVTLLFAVMAILKSTAYLELFLGVPRARSRRAVLLLSVVTLIAMLVFPSSKLRAKMEYCDSYLLFSFSQCYSDFYRREHPKEIFDAMTEYKWLIDRDFGHPKTFVTLLRNNPFEAGRYFFLNAVRNIHRVPRALLIVRDEGKGAINKRLYNIVMGVLVCGGLLGIIRARRCYLDARAEKTKPGGSGVAAFSQGENVLFRKILILLMLASASSVSIFLLVDSPRYWITMAPIVYLALACAVDCLFKQLRLARFEYLITTLAFVGFCSPNFIIPHPNFEFRALQHIAPLVKSHPVIGAWWALPDCVYGFNSDAQDVSISDGIKAEDIAAGRFDILLIDGNFRATETWARQHEFFENLMADPGRYGFKKVTDVPTGRFDILFRPVGTRI